MVASGVGGVGPNGLIGGVQSPAQKLDPCHLRVLTERGGNVADMLEIVCTSGELLCAVAEHLPPDDLNYPLPTLVVSHADAVLNHTIPLRALIQCVSEANLPLHAQQLQALTAQTTTC